MSSEYINTHTTKTTLLIQKLLIHFNLYFVFLLLFFFFQLLLVQATEKEAILFSISICSFNFKNQGQNH